MHFITQVAYASEAQKSPNDPRYNIKITKYTYIEGLVLRYS